VRRSLIKAIGFPALAVLSLACAHSEELPTSEGLQATYDEKSGHVLITDAGKPVLNYNYQTVPLPEGFAKGKYAIPRSNYLHPLFGPDGQELTTDWNKDHPHHRGIYWAWPEVQFNGEMGDLHALQRVWARPTGKIETRHGDDWAEVEAESRWMWEDKTPIVRETASIRAWKTAEHGRYVDLAFQFEALEDGVTLARRGTKAYGGLNIRLAPIKDMKLVHDADPAEATPRMAWQAANSTWAGATLPLSMVVFEKTGNPGYPADYAEYPDLPWFQPTFPKAGTRHALVKGEPLSLNYRIWIRKGPLPTEQQFRDQWKIYQKSDSKKK